MHITVGTCLLLRIFFVHGIYSTISLELINDRYFVSIVERRQVKVANFLEILGNCSFFWLNGAHEVHEDQ